MSNIKLDTVFSGIIAAAAVVLAATYAYGTFRPKTAASASAVRSAKPRLEFVRDWQNLARVGTRFGPANAKVQIVEFSDLECPYCKRSHEAVRAQMKAHPDDIAYYFVHYPLEMHRFAAPAAQAAECAANQGARLAMIDNIFRDQDSLGLKSWAAFAARSGVSDTIQFKKCIAGGVDSQPIHDGIETGRRIGVRATPTIIINGWRFASAPPPAQLDSLIDQIIAGKSLAPQRGDHE